MRFALGSLVCLLLVSAIGHGNGKPDPLAGTWKMNLARSSGSFPKEETLVIRIEDGTIEPGYDHQDPGRQSLRLDDASHGGRWEVFHLQYASVIATNTVVTLALP